MGTIDSFEHITLIMVQYCGSAMLSSRKNHFSFLQCYPVILTFQEGLHYKLRKSVWFELVSSKLYAKSEIFRFAFMKHIVFTFFKLLV